MKTDTLLSVILKNLESFLFVRWIDFPFVSKLSLNLGVCHSLELSET